MFLDQLHLLISISAHFSIATTLLIHRNKKLLAAEQYPVTERRPVAGQYSAARQQNQRLPHLIPDLLVA